VWTVSSRGGNKRMKPPRRRWWVSLWLPVSKAHGVRGAEVLLGTRSAEAFWSRGVESSSELEVLTLRG
jgi:hypothetical protein